MNGCSVNYAACISVLLSKFFGVNFKNVIKNSRTQTVLLAIDILVHERLEFIQLDRTED